MICQRLLRGHLYELASAEADVRAEVERRIAAGEVVSTAEVQADTGAARSEREQHE
jgi:hypothetical protein